MSRVLARLLVIVEQLMNSCLAVFRWISVTEPEPKLGPDEIALIRRCAAVIRGDVSGAEARPDAPPDSFPRYGRARIDACWLIWSGPYAFDLGVEFGTVRRVKEIPGVYWFPRQRVNPFAIIVAEHQTWASLWPPSMEE